MHGPRALLVAIPTALLVGCSLLVDTSGLSGEAAAPPVTADASPESSSTNGDASAHVDASSDAPDAFDGATSSTCPTGRGPDMVRLTDGSGTFCIDKTEVTDTQFNAFLADSARPSPPAKCSYRTTYGGATRPVDALPVTDVDWCEAWMFCAWAGKRLCGSRNGAVIKDLGTANNEKVSEWYAACSHAGNTTYPYGDVADKNRCNGCDRTDHCNADAGLASLVAVASLPCEGGYPGIFDMVGNVGEWEDNCDDASTAPLNNCPLRGGDRTLASTDTKCAVPNTSSYAHRQDRSPVSGIRCCAN